MVQSEQPAGPERERYEELVEMLPDTVFEIDIQGRIIYANRMAFTLFRATEEDLRRGTYAYNLIVPEERPRAIAKIRRAMTGEYQEDTNYTALRLDGTRFDAHIHSVPIIKNGVPVGLRGIITDISARKQTESSLRASENLYRTLFENTGAATAIIGADSVIKMANTGFARLSGLTREELEGKKRWSDFVHPEDLERLAGYHRQRRLYPSNVPTTYEFRCIDVHGRLLHCINNVMVIPESGDSVASIVDITHFKKLEAEFLQSQKMEAVGRLAGGIAHDFNNLLTAVSGFAELGLQTLSPQETARDFFEEILTAASRAADLTRQLLAFSRRQMISPCILDLNDLLKEMHGLMARLLGEDVRLEIKPSRGPRLIRVDSGQIQQVILNLAVNARDAMPEGGRLVLRTAAVKAGPEFRQRHPETAHDVYVHLSVSDSGTGMTKDVLDHLFEPFFTTKEKTKGTGLGLATVYGIVQQSGGFIHVESQPESGSTFHLYLPRANERQAMVPPRPAKGLAIDLTGHETVLIVEDEAQVRRLAARILKSNGYRVISAACGREALSKFGEIGAEETVFLLTDVVLPDLNGRQVARRITALRPDVRVLFMSGHAEEAIVHEQVLEPGLDFLPKPFTATRLLQTVRDILDHPLPPTKETP